MTNPIIKEAGTKYASVAAALNQLTGIVSIQDIVDAILSIDNFHQKTLKGMVPVIIGASTTAKASRIPLKDIFVDMTYQRRIRLRLIINKIMNVGGFDHFGAGIIDVADRKGDLFAWDGLRRCIKAGICGLSEIDASIMRHIPNKSVEDCIKDEARLFKMRNADQENMSFDEIFKSMVVYEDEDALKMRSLLRNCKLDVEGVVNEKYPSISVKTIWDNSFERGLKIENEHYISASEMLQNIFGDATRSAYLLLGLSWLLKKNHETTTPKPLSFCFSDSEIEESLSTYVDGQQLRQTDLTSKRVSGKNAQSVAYCIAKNALDPLSGIMNVVIDDASVELYEAIP